MTLYNILFGILFLGAVREVFSLIANPNAFKLPMAIMLTLVVFNDTLYTSHALDRNNDKYTVGMKFLDLANFLLIAFAMVALSPDGNLFVALPGDPKPLASVFWATVTLYGISAIAWNRLAWKTAKNGGSPSYDFVADIMCISPLVVFVVSLFGRNAVTMVFNYVIVIAFLFYMLVHKRRL